MTDIAAIRAWCEAGRLPESDEFFRQFTTDQGKFLDDEGLVWDFKDQWPFSHSDNYWGGIARLICAFANTLGGVLIIGVHDKHRNGGHNSVTVNVDRLNQAFTQLTGARPLFDVKRYSSETHGDVVGLLVPPRPESIAPYRFLTSVGPYQAGVLWVRDGHQVSKATPKDYPILFCRADDTLVDEGSNELSGSLPASPTTLKRFVGRTEVMDKLFDWLLSSDEPRMFIYGKGGSGKTAIAYEFAKLLKENGAGCKLFGGYPIDSVVFISAKEKQLIAATATIEDVSQPDFSSEQELYQTILTYGGWTTSSDVARLEIGDLKREITSFFDISSCLVVIDDVDTLTTKGLDAGFDFLYKVLARCKSGSKVLYTLRNAPSQSLLNSIEVPGLATGGEYELFVTACCHQFGPEEPPVSFRDSVLAKESERRPLVVETIIALRRTAGSYRRAVELFDQHAGSDVRDYVFSREWDALSADNLERFLLLALAELNRPATFAEIETILQTDPSSITDAIGAVREMFLQIDSASDETLYSIAQLTRRFVLSKRESLSRYAVIRERVRAFKKYSFSASAEVASVVLYIDRLLPTARKEHDQSRIDQAWSYVLDPVHGPKVTEDPIFRTVRGYVAAACRPPKLTEAREDFDYAIRMKYEPDFTRLRTWWAAEQLVEGFGARVEQIANYVIDGKRYSALEKTTMLQRKARMLFFRGRDRIHTEPTGAKRDLSESLKLHLKIFRSNVDGAQHWSHATAEHARNTAYVLFDLFFFGPQPIEVVDEIRDLVALKDVYLDPISAPVGETVERLVRNATTVELAHRVRNRTKGLAALVKTALWEEQSRAEHLSKQLQQFESALGERVVKKKS
jgi:hypothetical protein